MESSFSERFIVGADDDATVEELVAYIIDAVQRLGNDADGVILDQLIENGVIKTDGKTPRNFLRNHSEASFRDKLRDARSAIDDAIDELNEFLSDGR